MERIQTTELKSQVGRVVALIESGEEFLLTRRGLPIARIVPLPQRSRREIIEDMARLREMHEPVSLETIQEWIAEGRDA